MVRLPVFAVEMKKLRTMGVVMSPLSGRVVIEVLLPLMPVVVLVMMRRRRTQVARMMMRRKLMMTAHA
jgi:hypothetical protein